MQNLLFQTLMNQLQAKNPQKYQMINNAIQNGSNPKAFLQQMSSSMNPQQKQMLLNQAKSLGVPDNILGQIQNMR